MNAEFHSSLLLGIAITYKKLKFEISLCLLTNTSLCFAIEILFKKMSFMQYEIAILCSIGKWDTFFYTSMHIFVETNTCYLELFSIHSGARYSKQSNKHITLYLMWTEIFPFMLRVYSNLFLDRGGSTGKAL